MFQKVKITIAVFALFFATSVSIVEAGPHGAGFRNLAGSWIVDAGPGQIKTVTTYTPLGRGTWGAVESVFNFDWTLGGAFPTATHATTLNGILERNQRMIDFTLIAYALDDNEQAVYILKATGNKILVDNDTISVENLIFHIYDMPESHNPVTDPATFTIPDTGTFPPVHEYRIQ